MKRAHAIVQIPSWAQPVLQEPLVTPSGARASAVGDSIFVQNAAGETVAAYDAATRVLTVQSDPGSVAFRVRGDLRWQVDGRIDLEAAQGVHLSARAGEPGETNPTLDVTPDGIAMEGPSLDVRTHAARLAITTLDAAFESTSVVADRCRALVGTLDTEATQIIERAENTFREARDLAQITAARIRCVAEDAFHAFGARVVFKAERDLKLKGGKIHLG